MKNNSKEGNQLVIATNLLPLFANGPISRCGQFQAACVLVYVHVIVVCVHACVHVSVPIVLFSNSLTLLSVN